MRTKQEHIQWCKDRALDMYEHYKATDEAKGISEAALSVVSDIRKHPETASMLQAVFVQSQLVKTKADLDQFLGFLHKLLADAHKL